MLQVIIAKIIACFFGTATEKIFVFKKRLVK